MIPEIDDRLKNTLHKIRDFIKIEVLPLERV